MAVLDGFEQVLGSIVNTRNDVGISLRVGSPLNDDLVEIVLGLEVTDRFSTTSVSTGRKLFLPDVLANLLHVGQRSLAAIDHIIRSVLLVCCNEVGIVDTGQWNNLGHLFLDKGFQGGLQDCGPIHSLGEVHATDVPSTNDEVVGVHHRKHIVKRDVHILTGLGVRTQLHGRTYANILSALARLKL